MNTNPSTIHLTLHEGAARLTEAERNALYDVAGGLQRFQIPVETWELWLGLSYLVCYWLDIDAVIQAELQGEELLFTHQIWGVVATIRQD